MSGIAFYSFEILTRQIDLMQRPPTTYIYPLTAILWLVVLMQTSCRSAKFYSAGKKFSPAQLRKDYVVLQEALEQLHPSLYWYTPKDSMDFFFARYHAGITDSMTREEFGFRVLAPLTTHIRCGHTSFNYPKQYEKPGSKKTASFPLLLKMWPDTMVVTGNLNKHDSLLKRGTVITSINGRTERELTDSLFQFLPSDGYASNVNYIRLSAGFPYYHRNIFGLSDHYAVRYLDNTGIERETSVPLFIPVPDSTRKAGAARSRATPSRHLAKWDFMRSLRLDTARSMGVMTIHSFGGGTRLPHFYKQSFRKLKRQKIQNLVIDLRNNGGGKVNNYTALTRYIKDEPFKVADTVVAKVNHLGKYKKYVSNGLPNSLVLRFITRKQKDGRYHFNYWENHVFKPKKRLHFNGRIYLLINGPTFSASTLLAHSVKGQQNIVLVGEEAGGGWHGNNGILIPDLVLPVTKMRVRLPLFRIIQYKHVPKNGLGVLPDVYVPPTVENIRKSIDGKMKKVIEMINHSEMAVPEGDNGN